MLYFLSSAICCAEMVFLITVFPFIQLVGFFPPLSLKCIHFTWASTLAAAG